MPFKNPQDKAAWRKSPKAVAYNTAWFANRREVKRQIMNCTRCGTSLTGLRGNHRKFCSSKCAKADCKDRENAANRAATLERREAFKRPCIVCDAPIPTHMTKNAMTCSPECKSKRHSQRAGERVRASVEEQERRRQQNRARAAKRTAIIEAAHQLGLI